MKRYPTVSFNSIIFDLKITVIKPLSLLLLQLSCSIYHFYSLRKQNENHAQRGSEKKHNINQSRTASFWKVSKRKGQQINECQAVREEDIYQLTGVDSRTLDTAGDAAFPSTKRKKVETPITLFSKHPWQELL